MKKEIEESKKIIDTIKSLALDMIDTANSGHPGIVLSAAPTIYTLFANHLNIKSDTPNWWNRDRFVLSAGHGSALLYSTLFLAGYEISIEDLKKFRQINSILPGHPEYNLTPGVEFTTGPLGQGIASAVGMALAQRYLNSLLTKELPKQNIFNHFTYVLCGDGDLMEGISYEAASFAGTQKLNNLIVLYDSNDVSLDSSLNITFTENILTRFQSMGWHTEFVKDGNDTLAINKAIEKAKKTNLPSLIQIKTILGYGSNNQGKNIIHGKPLDPNDLAKLKDSFGQRGIPFTVSKDATVFFRNKIESRVNPIYQNWLKNRTDSFNIGNEYVKQIIKFLDNHKTVIDFTSDNLTINSNYIDEMRNSNNQIMNILSDRSLFFLGGSADLSSSTKTNLNKEKINSINDPSGKNIYFGVREHAMGAILNGMATYGLKVYGSTFLTFSDYLKPAIRISALMNIPVTYIFTHDSVSIGEDGATHQPVEQLAALRSIPNLNVYRPADLNEIIGCWENIVKENNPSVLVISKQKQEILSTTNAKQTSYGAYIVKKEVNKLDGIIVSTGTEVAKAIKIANNLYAKGIDLRVISMPCTRLFETNGIDFKNALFPVGVKVATLEASNDPIWYKYATNEKYVLKIDDFGYSGKEEDILKQFEFDQNSLQDRLEKLFK